MKKIGVMQDTMKQRFKLSSYDLSLIPKTTQLAMTLGILTEKIDEIIEVLNKLNKDIKK